MPDNEGRPPSKEDQVREAGQRKSDNEQRGVISQETVPESDVDLAAPQPTEREALTQRTDTDSDRGRDTRGEIKPRELPPGKVSRDDIVGNFRRNREEVTAREADDVDEMTELLQAGLPPELQEQVSDEAVGDEADVEPVRAAPKKPVQAAPEQEVEAEAPLFVIKVRGEERHVTEDQLFELAQKAAAGDDYLNEARTTLDNVKRLNAEAEAQRVSLATKHPGSQNNTQTTEVATDETAGSEHPDDLFGQLVESIQFGTKDEAAKKFKDIIESTVSTASKKATTEDQAQRRQQDELARANRAAAEFEKANPELASDPFAKAAVIDRCIKLQLEDLKSIPGIDASRLPNDPRAIQSMHLAYRADGRFNVKDASSLLNKAKEEFETWRGGKAKPAPQPTERPRISISAERTVRRQAVQQQPTRSVAPKPAVPDQKPPVEVSRSNAVHQMMQNRKLPRTAVARTMVRGA